MLSSFPEGTVVGPSMMYPEHLSSAIRCNNPEQSRIAMQNLTSLINFFSASRLPNDIGPTFCNASLTTLKKRKTAVRPIAVGEVFHRLMAKCLVSFAKEAAIEIVCPNQLGVSIRGGAESIIHAKKLKYVEWGKKEGLGFLQLNFENAFNSFKRQGVLSDCLKQIPCIYPFLKSCYAKHS